MRKAIEHKKFEDLQYTDDFMFGAVMENKEICKGVIETILDVKLKKVETVQIQKAYKDTSEARGIRLDAYVDDEEGTVYSVEMQAQPKRNLAKRSRFYQGNIDISYLKAGEDFEDLPRSYIIFICTFDPFGKKLARYIFENRCAELTDLALGDETTKVFINAKGITKDLPKKLKSFIAFIAHPEDESDDILVEAIKKEMARIKDIPERRNEFMTFEQAIYEAKKEAAKEATIAGRKQAREEMLFAFFHAGNTLKDAMKTFGLPADEVEKVYEMWRAKQS